MSGPAVRWSPGNVLVGEGRQRGGEGRGGEAAAAREQDAGLVEGSQSWPCAAASWEAF